MAVDIETLEQLLPQLGAMIEKEFEDNGDTILVQGLKHKDNLYKARRYDKMKRSIKSRVYEYFTSEPRIKIEVRYPPEGQMLPRGKFTDRLEKSDKTTEQIDQIVKETYTTEYANDNESEPFDAVEAQLKFLRRGTAFERELKVWKLRREQADNNGEEFTEKRPEYPFSELEKLKRKKLWEFLRRAAVRETRCIVTTVNNLHNDLMKGNVAYGAKGIVMIIDEATTLTEPSFWGAVIQCITTERVEAEWGGVHPVKVIILAGDPEQLCPLVTSGPKNEFAEQLKVPIYLRLLNGRVKAVDFKQQARMHPQIAMYPNERFYNGAITDHPHVQRMRFSQDELSRVSSTLNPGQQINLRERYPDIIGTRDTDQIERERRYDHDLRTWLVNVTNGQVLYFQESRFNLHNIPVTFKLIKDLVFTPLRDASGRKFFLFKPNEVAIVTPYRAQCGVYEDAVVEFSRQMGSPVKDLSMVHGLDSFELEELNLLMSSGVNTIEGRAMLLMPPRMV